MEYQFQYLRTANDFVDGYLAEHKGITTVSSFFKGALIAVVIFVIFTVVFSTTPNHLVLDNPFIWLAGSCILAWHFVVKSFLEIKYLKRSHPHQKKMFMNFYRDRIELNSGKNGLVVKKWQQITKLKDFQKGILMDFDDGYVVWLPNRLFDSLAQEQQFIQYAMACMERD